MKSCETCGESHNPKLTCLQAWVRGTQKKGTQLWQDQENQVEKEKIAQ